MQSQDLGPQQESFESLRNGASPTFVAQCGSATDFATRLKCGLTQDPLWNVSSTLQVRSIEFVLCLCYNKIQFLLITSDGVTQGSHAECRQCPFQLKLGNVSLAVDINVTTDQYNVTVLTMAVSE